MANNKSSKKRILINKLRNRNNISKKSMLKTYIKKFKLSIKNKNKKSVIIYYTLIQSLLDKLSSKKVIHFNKSSRYKSSLSKLMNFFLKNFI